MLNWTEILAVNRLIITKTSKSCTIDNIGVLQRWINIACLQLHKYEEIVLTQQGTACFLLGTKGTIANHYDTVLPMDGSFPNSNDLIFSYLCSESLRDHFKKEVIQSWGPVCTVITELTTLT